MLHIQPQEVPLRHYYPGRNVPQPAYLWLDCRDGSMWCGWWDHLMFPEVPDAVRAGMVLWWEIPPYRESIEAHGLMQKVAVYAIRIVSGYCGSTGLYSLEAHRARNAVSDICKKEMAGWEETRRKLEG